MSYNGSIMNACICLVGWHFPQDLLDTLQNDLNLPLFIVSHQPRSVVPEWVLKSINERNIFFEKNIGYDWGAYQQFIEKGIWKNFDNIFFMHDDITLLDRSVFQICHDLMRTYSGNLVIGNGRNTNIRDWPRTNIQCYAHSLWKPPSWDFEHDTVRGSFFALSKSTLEKVIHFEPLWDRRRLYGLTAGNFSLRATCGKIQHLLGDHSFFFLSESYRRSPYIIELERGQENLSHSNKSLGRIIKLSIMVRFSKRLMTLYMNSNSVNKQRLAKFMQFLFSYI
jgi:hypothetical protein